MGPVLLKHLTGVQKMSGVHKQIILLLILTLLVVFSTNARECQGIEDQNSGCDILIFTTNATDQSQILTGATCTINITQPGGDLSAIMTNGAFNEGWHNYTFVESGAGVHPIQILCTISNFSTRLSSVITVDVSDQSRLNEINNTVDAIRTTDVPTITGNQVEIEADTNQINNTLFNSVYGLEALSDLILGLNNASVADIVSAVFDGIISISGKDLNETLGDIYNVTVTIQDGKNLNWSAISNINNSQVWEENLSNHCQFNISFNPDTAGRYMCDLWRFN